METLLVGNCLTLLDKLADNSIDAIVTDPPYELAFMGKKWDATGIAFQVALWEKAFRVLKPGGHLLAFGGTRTHHRMTCAIEDAGFEIRDELDWIYGSGMPKSLDISKALDKAAGAGATITAPATALAEQWEGWGTALKPAREPIVMARKPLVGTVARNVATHGVGGINIDASRIGPRDRTNYGLSTATRTQGSVYGAPNESADFDSSKGRFPANLILDPDAAAELDAQSGITTSGAMKREVPAYDGESVTQFLRGRSGPSNQRGDTGGASRFFYVTKTSTKERNAGCEHLPNQNNHPTVKPIALMRYLVRLITPPGGVVLDPFAGSGSTGCACVLEDFRFIGMEMVSDHARIANCRLAYWRTQKDSAPSSLDSLFA